MPRVRRARDTVRVAIGPYTGEAVRGIDAGCCQRTLGDLLASRFAAPAPVTRARDREVYRVSVAPGDRAGLAGATDLYVKRYRLAGLWPRVEALVGMHKSQRAWRVGRQLYERGVPTPRPLLSLRGPASERVVVTAGIPGGASLRDYVAERLPPATGGAASDAGRLRVKRAVIAELAGLLARVHLARAYHGDFTARNVLVCEDGGDVPRAFLLDIDAVRHAWRISARRRVKNLDEIGRNFLDLRVFTTADRVRFLHHYAAVAGVTPAGTRRLFHRVWRRTQFRLAKYGHAFR